MPGMGSIPPIDPGDPFTNVPHSISGYNPIGAQYRTVNYNLFGNTGGGPTWSTPNLLNALPSATANPGSPLGQTLARTLGFNTPMSTVQQGMAGTPLAVGGPQPLGALPRSSAWDFAAGGPSQPVGRSNPNFTIMGDQRALPRGSSTKGSTSAASALRTPGRQRPPSTGRAGGGANRPPPSGRTPSGGRVSPLSGRASTGSRLGMAGRFGGAGLALFGAGPAGTLVEDAVGDFTGNDRLGMAAGQATSAGLAGLGLTRSPLIGGAAAAIGGGAGLLGVDLSDVPLFGQMFFPEGEADAEDGEPVETQQSDLDQVNSTFDRVLTGLGADPSFVNRATTGLALTLEMNPGVAEDPSALAALAQQTLQTYIGEWSAEQERAYYESSVAAVQAWMEPYLRQQLGAAQWYADSYAAQATAAADQITDPAVREAVKAQAAMYSTVQANANAYALQQMMFYPEALLEQVNANYQSEIEALRAENEMSAGLGYGYYISPLPMTGSAYQMASTESEQAPSNVGAVGENPSYDPLSSAFQPTEIPGTLAGLPNTGTTVPQLNTAPYDPLSAASYLSQYQAPQTQAPTTGTIPFTPPTTTTMPPSGPVFGPPQTQGVGFPVAGESMDTYAQMAMQQLGQSSGMPDWFTDPNLVLPKSR